MPELKPCPNCGCTRVWESEVVDGGMECSQCGMAGPTNPDVDKAISDWNDLPRKSDLLALIEDRLANLEATDPSDTGNAYIAGQRDALIGLRDALSGGREVAGG